MKSQDAYPELLERLRRLHTLYTVADLLSWDEQVNLPPDSSDQRLEQLSLLAELQHSEGSAPRIGELISALESEGSSLSAPQLAVVKMARKNFDRVAHLPVAFVREKAEHCSRSYHAWVEARQKSDFASFAPFIAKHLELARKEASLMGWGDRAYDYLLDLHDPGVDSAFLQTIFEELRSGLVPFAQQVVSSPVKADTGFLRGYDVEAQKRFARDVVASLGLNFKRGRLDESVHPFCSGTGADLRMTTRFDVNNPFDSLFSAIHESGHGLYEQGLPREHPGSALSLPAGMAVHESQSRLWENQVARSHGFWNHFEPRFRAAFPDQMAGVSSEAMYLAVNAVTPTLIRVDSDEVTYNLHILLRFDIERRLFSGEIKVEDLPRAWKIASLQLLGLLPENDREGVLQDVHWSCGDFGYFPSYTLGNMFAAQLWYRALELMPGMEYDFACGDFTKFLGWLRQEVHSKGCQYTLPELVRRSTGAELSPKPLLRYLKERYGPLYLHEG
jgi:carboxypeptidase Taq